MGIILSHRCWVDPPPPARQVGHPRPEPPLPSRRPRRGGGGDGLPCHPPPAEQFSSRPVFAPMLFTFRTLRCCTLGNVVTMYLFSRLLEGRPKSKSMKRGERLWHKADGTGLVRLFIRGQLFESTRVRAQLWECALQGTIGIDLLLWATFAWFLIGCYLGISISSEMYYDCKLCSICLPSGLAGYIPFIRGIKASLWGGRTPPPLVKT